MKIHLDLEKNGYDIIIERGALHRIGEIFSLHRKVMIVTDDGVPIQYAKKVAEFCDFSEILVLKAGEESKNFANLQKILAKMVENHFARTDCVVAVGGGVVGDMAGFAAAIYMRGIDFYNVPTTVLSAVDSSIGGKTAIDFENVKNIVGAFHQPRAVVIDPDTLATLPKRHVANGLAEALKMALTSDPVLFDIFEKGNIGDDLEDIIIRSVMIKKSVVEQDEYESGLRKILNFGHTLGHGIEAAAGFSELYHGECVALGMIPMCAKSVRERLLPVLEKLHLPTRFDGNLADVMQIAAHDKKRAGEKISVVFVDTIGAYEIKNLDFSDWEQHITEELL